MEPPIWFRAYAPRLVMDAARILAEHVDYWEEASPSNRELSAFLFASAHADQRQEGFFRQLLARYVEAAVDSGTTRTQPSDDEFHRHRRHLVRDAISQIKHWLGERGNVVLPAAGKKRNRLEIECERV